MSVLYIGKATSLKVRWKGHEKMRVLRWIPAIRLYYVVLPSVAQAEALEADEVKRFRKPWLNKNYPGGRPDPLRKRKPDRQLSWGGAILVAVFIMLLVCYIPRVGDFLDFLADLQNVRDMVLTLLQIAG